MKQILSGDNLREAHRAVKRNNGTPGVDGITVDAIAAHMRQHGLLIQHKLYEVNYQTTLLIGVKIQKSNGGEHLQGILTVQYRIIQQAALA